MTPKTKVPKEISQDELNQRITSAAQNCEDLIHQLRLSYDIRPNKRISDIIVAQELSLMELKALLI